MNGIHDMGGMQGLGEIGYEEHPPVFHAPWEGRMHAMVQAMGPGGLRSYLERIPAADYLRMSYYERWYTALVARLIETGVVTHAEVESGRADPAAAKATPTLTPAVARELLFRTPRTERDMQLAPRFQVGNRVRGRNIHPTTHTRMPRYTRGRTGVVELHRGVFNLPDSEHVSAEPKGSVAQLMSGFSEPSLMQNQYVPPRQTGEAIAVRSTKPQHVYLVRFTAQELWGEAASAHDALYIDMWEDYLEPV